MEQEKNKKLMNNILMYIALFVCILVFIGLVFCIQNNKTVSFDKYIYDFVIKLKSDDITAIFKGITSLCNAIFMIVLVLVLLLIIKNKNYPVTLMLNLIGVAAINKIIKYIFLRQRPVGINLIKETGYSFPSRTFNDRLCFLWLCYISNI